MDIRYHITGINRNVPLLLNTYKTPPKTIYSPVSRLNGKHNIYDLVKNNNDKGTFLLIPII